MSAAPQPGLHEPQEAYDGPAVLVAAGTEHPVSVTLRGAFQPLDGHFHWYGRIAVEAAKMMRTIDPSIELAAVGSSGRNMPTFGAWEREVLRHTFHEVEFISLHTYLNDYAKDTPAFLASSDLMDGFIEEVVGIADEIAAELGSDKTLWLECNAAELNGVSFAKGCYVGQENTARMNWRQKVNRRLVVVPSDTPGPRARIHYPALGLAVEHRRVDDLGGALIPGWLAAALQP